MTEDPGTLRARLDRLAALVELAQLSRSEEDRARMERSIQLVSWALQTVAHARRQRGDPAIQCEAAEVEALCRESTKNRGRCSSSGAACTLKRFDISK
jgi:hypothetical protein